MSNGLIFAIFLTIDGELTEKSTKNMRYRFTKIIVSYNIGTHIIMLRLTLVPQTNVVRPIHVYLKKIEYENISMSDLNVLYHTRL